MNLVSFWVSLMSVITLLSIAEFVFIGVSSLKKEHKKRLQRSKSNNNNIESGQTSNDNKDEEDDDILFDDDFRILPRNSFIMKVVRQFSNISHTTNKSETNENS